MPFFAGLVALVFAAGVAGAAPAEESQPVAEVSREEPPPSPVAMNHQANLFLKGRGVKQDFAKALHLFERAANEGHTASMISAGYMYENGLGVARDFAAAMQWYERAAAQGYASAQKAIGDLYRLGRGVKQDDAAAAQWYQKAADQGFAQAQCELGYLMIRGRGVPQDWPKAKLLLEAGAGQGNACAQHYLAFMYMHGLIGRLPDTERALELDKMAAGNGNAEAQFNMGRANEIGWVPHATEREALNWYALAAGGGYPPAMARLAEVYEKGELKEKADPEKARMWRERAQAAWADWPEPRPDAKEKIRFMPLK